MGFGILLCLFGFRYLRFTLLLTGFIGGGKVSNHSLVYPCRLRVLSEVGESLTVFFFIALISAIAAYAILLNTEPDGLRSNRVLIYVAVCIAAGLLIGLIMLSLNKYATWVLGGAGGKPSFVRFER